MKRLKRTDVKPRKRRQPRNLKRLHVYKRLALGVDVPMYYSQMSLNVEHGEKIRFYFVGAVAIAVMKVFKNKPKACIFIKSSPGNGGNWFSTVRKGEAFLREELQRKPTQ